MGTYLPMSERGFSPSRVEAHPAGDGWHPRLVNDEEHVPARGCDGWLGGCGSRNRAVPLGGNIKVNEPLGRVERMSGDSWADEAYPLDYACSW
jgi:hypothetical protein